MSTSGVLENAMVKNLFDLVINPVVVLIFSVAVLYFIWGVFKYIQNADDPSERAAGGRHIIFGIFGIFIMISVWGIISVIGSTLGVKFK